MSEPKENAPWVTFRPEIKVLDCTVRDGGLINAHQFEDNFVKAVYDTCIESGIDYMELGYKASKDQFARADFGDWKFCDEDDIRRIVGENDTPLKLTAMADAGKTDYKTDILPSDQSVLDCIRVATYAHQIPTAVEMIKDAHDKGYETCCNIMAISTVADSEIDKALETLAETPVETVVVVDSYGALYHEQIRALVKKYVAMANATEYGLAGSVWTKDAKRGHAFGQRLDTGIVWVNTWLNRDLRTPFGGVKQSGVGREGGAWSLNFFSELTNICVLEP